MVKIPVRGTAALLTAATIVAVTLIWLPAYRLFFAISLGLGALVAEDSTCGITSDRFVRKTLRISARSG